MQLADILKAPSLEISLRTATELDSQSEENNAKVYESNGTSEQCRPSLSLHHLINNERPPNMPIKPPRQPKAQQQQSGIKILHDGKQLPPMMLQGTIYSDGKSSTVMSPSNAAQEEGKGGIEEIKMKIKQTPSSEDKMTDDSSLLISEETQANKRTQSSCKKTQMGQLQNAGNNHDSVAKNLIFDH